MARDTSWRVVAALRTCPTHILHTECQLPHLRNATTGDAAALAALAEHTFRDTFAAMNAAEDMDRHCRQNYGASIQAAKIADPARVTLVCETLISKTEGELVAYAQLRWGKAPACKAKPPAKSSACMSRAIGTAKASPSN